MKVFPTQLALAATGLWCVLALAAVFFPALGLLLALVCAVGLAAAVGDAIACARAPHPELVRVLPGFGLQDRPLRLALVVRNLAANSPCFVLRVM